MSKNTLVVICGSGRSGTSLLARRLIKNEKFAGAAKSQSFVEASIANKDGPFEDAYLFQLHSSLLDRLDRLPASENEPYWEQDINWRLTTFGRYYQGLA